MGAFEFIAYSKCAYYNRLDVAPLGSRPAGVGGAGASDVDVLAGEGSRCRISVTHGTSYTVPGPLDRAASLAADQNHSVSVSSHLRRWRRWCGRRNVIL